MSFRISQRWKRSHWTTAQQGKLISFHSICGSLQLNIIGRLETQTGRRTQKKTGETVDFVRPAVSAVDSVVVSAGFHPSSVAAAVKTARTSC